MPAPPSGNLLDVFEARERPYLARLRQNPRLLRLREQIHRPMVVLSADEALIRFEELEYQANRWRRSRRVVYVPNVCELFDTIDTIDAKEANEANLLSVLRRPRSAATGHRGHRKSDPACAVGRGPCIRRA